MKYTLLFIYSIVAIVFFMATVKAEVSNERLELELQQGQKVLDALILANVMICEASTEGRIGMLAVANVVMNRVKHPRFPNTIEGVVYQKHQFECVQKGIQYGFKDYGFKQAYNMAISVIEGRSPKITNATHYFQYKLINPPFWATNDKYLGTIGNHKFYRVYN